jgi:hypothetical protein
LTLSLCVNRLRLHKFWPVLVAGMLSMSCRSTGCTQILAQAPWEENTRAHLNSYGHILVATIYEDRWEDKGPGQHSLHHFNAKVTKVFKGDWKIAERIAIVHGVDAPASTAVNAQAGKPLFVFTNQHTNTPIPLDTGEFGNYIPHMERILKCVFP